MTLLDISELTLDLPNGTRLLDGISLTVAEGETVGLVGESGSGKSLTARSVLGLLPDRAETGGSVHLLGRSVLGASRGELLDLRRTSASMIFQDPRAGINPMRTVGDHLTETMRLCEKRSAADARAVASSLLAAVRHAATRGAPAPVPARTLGRHAAARHDRGRAHELASPAHLRRADHGARRDHAGRDPRGARRAARESRHGHALHHARPESRRVDLRSRLRHERGPGRGAGRCPTGVPRSAGRVHEAAGCGDSHDRSSPAPASVEEARQRRIETRSRDGLDTRCRDRPATRCRRGLDTRSRYSTGRRGADARRERGLEDLPAAWQGAGACRHRRVHRDSPRRRPRHRRRIGVGQVDARPHDRRARAGRCRATSASRARTHRGADHPQGAPRARTLGADGVPGPVPLARPADHGRPGDRGCASPARPPHHGRRAYARGRTARAGGPRRPARAGTPAHALGRAAAARRDRPSPRDRARRARHGRGDECARRVGAGAGARRGRAHPPRAGPDGALHQPRPRRRAPAVRRDRRDEQRRDRRAGRTVELLGDPQQPYTRLLIDSVPRPDWGFDALAAIEHPEGLTA